MDIYKLNLIQSNTLDVHYATIFKYNSTTKELLHIPFISRIQPSLV